MWPFVCAKPVKIRLVFHSKHGLYTYTDTLRDTHRQLGTHSHSHTHTHTHTHTLRDRLSFLCVRPIHFATSGPRLDLVRVPLRLTLSDLKLPHPPTHTHKDTHTHLHMHIYTHTHTNVLSKPYQNTHTHTHTQVASSRHRSGHADLVQTHTHADRHTPGGIDCV